MNRYQQNPDCDNHVGGVCMFIFGVGFIIFSVWLWPLQNTMSVLMYAWGVILIVFGDALCK